MKEKVNRRIAGRERSPFAFRKKGFTPSRVAASKLVVTKTPSGSENREEGLIVPSAASPRTVDNPATRGWTVAQDPFDEGQDGEEGHEQVLVPRAEPRQPLQGD